MLSPALSSLFGPLGSGPGSGQAGSVSVYKAQPAWAESVSMLNFSRDCVIVFQGFQRFLLDCSTQASSVF